MAGLTRPGAELLAGTSMYALPGGPLRPTPVPVCEEPSKARSGPSPEEIAQAMRVQRVIDAVLIAGVVLLIGGVIWLANASNPIGDMFGYLH